MFTALMVIVSQVCTYLAVIKLYTFDIYLLLYVDPTSIEGLKGRKKQRRGGRGEVREI